MKLLIAKEYKQIRRLNGIEIYEYFIAIIILTIVGSIVQPLYYLIEKEEEKVNLTEPQKEKHEILETKVESYKKEAENKDEVKKE